MKHRKSWSNLYNLSEAHKTIVSNSRIAQILSKAVITDKIIELNSLANSISH